MAAMLCVAKNMWVATLHFVGDAGEDIFQREQTFFFSHARMEDDLELEIAEFVCKRIHILAGDRIGDLIGFLDRIGRDRFERLDRVPFTSAYRITQSAHDLTQALKRHWTRRKGLCGPLALYIF